MLKNGKKQKRFTLYYCINRYFKERCKMGTRKTTIIGIVVMALYLITMLLMPRFKHYNMS